jgi:hypothetical protein
VTLSGGDHAGGRTACRVRGARQDGIVASSENAGWEGDDRAVRVIRPDPGIRVDTSRWPGTVPAVEQLLCEGLELPAGLTVLVGENGSGKSTVMEMLAGACGLNPQGGSAQARLFRLRDSEPGAGAQLIVERGPLRPRWSYFLFPPRGHHAQPLHLPGRAPWAGPGALP